MRAPPTVARAVVGENFVVGGWLVGCKERKRQATDNVLLGASTATLDGGNNNVPLQQATMRLFCMHGMRVAVGRLLFFGCAK